jgi:hypothetical protein
VVALIYTDNANVIYRESLFKEEYYEYHDGNAKTNKEEFDRILLEEIRPKVQ